jgi:hypothetical protein
MSLADGMASAPLQISPFKGAAPLNAWLGALTIVALLAGGAHAETKAPTPAASAAKADVPKTKSPEPASKPSWSKLTPAQQVALAPLAPAWSRISEGQRRKWIALSQNYPGLSEAERTTLHGRMTEWAGLSAAQRSQARLNFAQTKQLSTEEKKTQWQAYQALSDEQKKQLASAARRPKATGAAPAVPPVATNKLALVPITRSEPHAPLGAASRPSAPASPRIVGAASAPSVQP